MRPEVREQVGELGVVVGEGLALQRDAHADRAEELGHREAQARGVLVVDVGRDVPLEGVDDGGEEVVDVGVHHAVTARGRKPPSAANRSSAW